MIPAICFFAGFILGIMAVFIVSVATVSGMNREQEDKDQEEFVKGLNKGNERRKQTG